MALGAETLNLDDTIAAISTPPGPGAIGIVRLTGPQSRAIIARLFVPLSHAVQPWADEADSHRLTYGHIVTPDTGERVDEVLVAVMRAPHTYTLQDVVEINAHGGTVALQEILRLTLDAGARPAQAGEFTLRAFVNGRLDLAQAEAVLDVISAKTSAALRVATRQLDGQLSDQVQNLRRELVDLLAYLEASIDFTEDEVPSQDVLEPLNKLARALADMLAQANHGQVYRQGVRTAIVGRPNVGKSSLLNRLLRTERAIVTPVAGTTRDTLEETLNLQGVPFVLMDTAGINQSQDMVERMGVERSHQALQGADLVLLLVDGSVPPDPQDQRVAALIGERPALLVVNKSDLAQKTGYGALLPQAKHVAVSALTGQGLTELEQSMLRLVLGGEITLSDTPLVSSPRHQSLLRRALNHVGDALQAAHDGLPEDLISIDVREAVQALGEITGEDASEDLLATIFSRFCIGK